MADNEMRQKAIAYLKTYVNQMKAAGFPDYKIKETLEKTRQINIPDTEVPQNTWATGMKDEFMQGYANNPSPAGSGAWKEFVPSPNEYLNYSPGFQANRLPTGQEFYGQQTSPFYNTSGKFSQTKDTNLRNALANHMANYKGETIGPSQYAYEAGIVGMPQDIGQQYYQEFLSLAQQKAAEQKGLEEAQGLYTKSMDEYNDLILTAAKMGIQVEETDTPQDIMNKIAETSAGQTTAQEDKAFVINQVIGKFTSGEWDIQTAYAYAIDNGVVLSMDDLMDIYYQYFPKGQ